MGDRSTIPVKNQIMINKSATSKSIIYLTLFSFFIIGCTSEKPSSEQAKNSGEVVANLPFQQLALHDLNAFQSPGKNWSLKRKVLSDFSKENDIQSDKGEGVLLNLSSDQTNSNLSTSWEHGDLEIELDFLVPKGSNSGLYFQGRYEVQILDSWKKENPSSSDCGGIYERWDDSKPEGKKGFEGYAPQLNASLAPGLWQHYHIIFRAPRFDDTGKKIENAKFEKVVHNGVTIHEDVELSGPTRGAISSEEVAMAPLMIQGDHGPVAFRNIHFKKYGADTLRVNNIQYKYFEVDIPITQLPNFDTLTVLTSGKADKIDVNELSKRRDGVAFQFTADLEVQKSGTYLFHLYSDDGSRLFIDDRLIIDHDGKHDLEPKRSILELSEGTYPIKIDYFNNNWGKGLMIHYEGPEQQLRLLEGRNPYPVNNDKKALLIEPGDRPEMIRSFVNYGDQKKTHAISVGHPDGVHYSYDLDQGVLLKVWKGGFADVTNMWQGRGNSQLLVPQSMAMEVQENIICDLKSNKIYNETLSNDIHFKGYKIDDSGTPIFQYNFENNRFFDQYKPNDSATGLIRTIYADSNNEMHTRIGFGKYIEKVNDQYYSIDGKMYAKILSGHKPTFRKQNEQTEMLISLQDQEKLVYEILW